MSMLITDYLENIPEGYEVATAFITPNKTVTYGDLRKKAKSIASLLLQKELFREPIALVLPESIDCIASFLGVAYSGNYYSPFEPSMPENRLNMMLRQYRPSLIVTNNNAYDRVRAVVEEIGNIEIAIYEEIILCPINNAAIKEARKRMTDNDLLYVLYTSGSTGTPKGVAVPHKNVNFVCESHSKAFSLNHSSVIGNQFSIYFAASVFVIYTTIANYAVCCIGFGEIIMSPEKWRAYVENNKINALTGMPATFRLLKKCGCIEKGRTKEISKIILGGDKMYVREAKELIRVFSGIELYAIYGATEVGGVLFALEINEWLRNAHRGDNDALPMGRSFENIDVYLVDENMKKTHTGEMYIGFSALPYGYYDNGEKTAETYVQNPFHTHYPEAVFKSRDKVKLNNEGIYEYIGRMDFMIKKSGYRIEPGDVESAVYQNENVDQCCCFFAEDTEQMLLIYMGNVEERALYNHIKEILPTYMMPNKIIKIKEMPLNTNGKIDRRKLKIMAESDG